MSDNDNENLRPSKMRGVAFPKAKYGVIAAIIIIVIVNILYYKNDIIKLFFP
jgi:cell division protein FtsL